MAAAEARAAWQRTANRYFVQEDAKRAPKWACCSNSAAQSHSDPSLCDSGSGSEYHVVSFLPANWKSSHGNLSHDVKWWMQGRESFSAHKDSLCGQPNAMKPNSDDCTSVVSPEDSVEDPLSLETQTDQGSGFHVSKGEISNVCEQDPLQMRKFPIEAKEGEIWGKRIASDVVDNTEYTKGSYDEHWDQDHETTKSKVDDYSMLEGYRNYAEDVVSRKVCEKEGLSWRTADQAELASLVAKKSLEHIENCDLPPPQVKYSNSPFLSIQKSRYGELPTLHYQDALEYNGGSLPRSCKAAFPLSVSTSIDEVPSLSKEFQNSWRGDCGRTSSETVSKTWSESKTSFESDGGKAQLLEALCHSQTRAREAEQAAAKAVNEREWLLQMFFKEASYLFAYRQWLRILQIETFCLQIQLNERPLSWENLCALVPWKVSRDRPKSASKRGCHKKQKSRKKVFDVDAWSFVVALGIGLAGAGLFIGWSVGWLLRML